MNNGSGLRVVLWLSGCSHNCYSCQNPQTWNPNGGILFDDESIKEIFDELSKDYISGITLSGGDPLYSGNLNDVFHLISTIRNLFPTKTIWLYTGFTWEQIMNPTNSDDILRKETVSQCDVVVDGEYIDELRDITLKWRGSSNQRVIDVKKSIEKGEVVLWSD